MYMYKSKFYGCQGQLFQSNAKHFSSWLCFSLCFSYFLVGTTYRPPNQNSEFFTAFPKLIENIWIKFSNIILLGDFYTNLLQDERGNTSYEGNKMKGILQQFNMKNVVKGPTRITNILKR